MSNQRQKDPKVKDPLKNVNESLTFTSTIMMIVTGFVVLVNSGIAAYMDVKSWRK